MKFAIYYREREYAREMGDPKLAEVDAPTKEQAERISSHLAPAGVGTWAVPVAKGPWRGVFFDGPQADQDRDGDEIPVWFVYIGNEEAEPVGKVYFCHACADADALARKMSRVRRLEPLQETTPA